MSEQNEQIEQLKAAIQAQENLRGLLGDSIVNAGILALQEKLKTLEANEALRLQKQRRKQITVMFVDIANFTALTEKLDVELVGKIVNDLWQRLDKIILNHAGVIDKHIGDALMAVWGGQTAQEDDAEKAVRAALDIQAALQSQVDAQDWPIHVRIGINTGLALLGESGTIGENTVLGSTINLASRLTKVGGPGQVIITHETYRQVQGVFDVLALDPVVIKGLQGTTQLYRVLQTKPRAFRMGTRGIEGIATRMVGRAAELQELQTLLQQVISCGMSQMVAIIGEAGIGKSRLLYEFLQWVELFPVHIRLFKGRASPSTLQQPYAFLRDLLAFRFQILDSDSPAAAYDKIQRAFSQVFTEQDIAYAYALPVGKLIGLEVTQAGASSISERNLPLKELALPALDAYFQKTAAVGPLLALLEDLHWIDQSSFEILRFLSQSLSSAPVLFVSTARPTIFEQSPAWRDEPLFRAKIVLEPLSKSDSRVLVEEILRKVEHIPDALRELIISQSDGNPYYLEEIIKMLIQERVIFPDSRSADLWRVAAERLVQVNVPSTLTGILQTRIDALPNAERAILQVAAVVGRVFWEDAIKYLVAHAPSSLNSPIDITLTLQSLTEREMVFPRKSSAFQGINEYVFKHALLREVAYEGVLLTERRHYHRNMAEWLQIQVRNRAFDRHTLIAEHLELAGQAEQAAQQLLRAANHAVQVSAYHEALIFLERAQALLPNGHSALENVIIQTGITLVHIAHHSEARQKLTEGLRLAQESQNQANQAAALTFLGVIIAREQGDYCQALEYLNRGFELAHQVQDRSGAARILVEAGHVAMMMGNVTQASIRLQQSLEIYRQEMDDYGITYVLNRLGNVAAAQSKWEEAQELYEASLTKARQLGDRRTESMILNNQGEVARKLANYALAKQYYQQSLEICRQINNQIGISITLANLGHVTVVLGDPESAQALFRQSIEVAQNVGAQPFILDGLAGLAHAQAVAGQVEQALDVLCLVSQHPALQSDTQPVIQMAVQQLSSRLSRTEIEARLLECPQSDLETLVSYVLRG